MVVVASKLLEMGYRVRLVCLEKAPPEHSLSSTMPVEYLSGRRSTQAAAVKLLALVPLALRLAALVKRGGVRVVVSHLFRANFVNVLARTLGRSRHRAVLVNHTRVSRLRREGLAGKVSWLLCRLLYPRAETVASVSAGAEAECARLLRLTGRQRLVLHDPVDVDEAAEARFSAKRQNAIVTVGRLVKLKRLHDVIDAFADVASDYPDLELRLAGEGPEREALRIRAAQRGVAERVRFLGNVANPLPALAGCSIFASASETEGFGMSIVEALAAGTAVVAADCAYGPREILSPHSGPKPRLTGNDSVEVAPFGLLCPVGSPKAMAEALRLVLADTALRARLETAGPGRAKDFSVESSAAGYARVIDR